MPTPDDHTSKSIAKAVSGDCEALERLLVGSGAKLSRHISQKLPSLLLGRETVEDILQQTYVQAIRGINRLEATTEKAFVAWLKTIAENQIHNAVIAHQRKKRSGRLHRLRRVENSRNSSLGDIVDMLCDQGDTPGRGAARQESILAMQVAIATLPDQQRRAVELRFMQGKSVAETAIDLRRSPGAVNALLNRAKQNLRDSLNRSSKWLEKKV